MQHVARAMGLDRRIGPKFLHAGPGYGGSCFPKDTRSAAFFARELGLDFRIVEATIEVNAAQRERMVGKIVAALSGDVSGKKIGVLGLSFKPETDDIREAPATDIVSALLERGAEVRAYDPAAMKEMGEQIPSMTLCKDAYEVCAGADALVIVTEWNEFRMLDFERIRNLLSEPILVDLRNIYDPASMTAAGFHYTSVGR